MIEIVYDKTTAEKNGKNELQNAEKYQTDRKCSG